MAAARDSLVGDRPDVRLCINLEGTSMADSQFKSLKFTAFSLILCGVWGNLASAQTVLFYEDFYDGAFAQGGTIFTNLDSTASLENGVAKINDVMDRSGFSVVRNFDEPLMTFQFDYVETVTPTNAQRMEVLLRAGIGTAQRTLSSTEQVVEAITFRGTDATGTRIGEGIENKTVFLAYNNKDTDQTFVSPVDGVTEVLLTPWQYVPYTLDRTTMTYTAQPKGVSSASLAGTPGPEPANITRFGIGSSSNADQGTFAIDNVMVRAGLVFDRTFPTTALQADFDGNKTVANPDLGLLTTRFGNTAAPLADTDSDGDTDGQDFLQWQRSLGSSIPAVAAGGAVPEPTTLAGALIAVVVLCRPARKRSSGISA